MKVAVVDFETTGLDPAKDRITEWGVTVVESNAPDEEMAILARAGGFLWEPFYPEITAEITEITGITQAMLDEKGRPFWEMIRAFARELPEFDCFISHSAYSLDVPIFRAEMLRHKGDLPAEVFERLMNLPWLCSIQDVVYPVRAKCRVLSHLALELGIQVDIKALHRATADTDLLAEVLAQAKVDFKQALAYNQIPWVFIRAVVPSPYGKGNDGGVGKDKAKACGFGWTKAPRTDKPEFPNCWVKRIKENEVEKEQETLGYPVVILQEKSLEKAPY